MGQPSEDPNWRGFEVSLRVDEALQRAAPPAGFVLGLGELDRFTGGIRPGDVWVVEGRPGAGTSTLGLQIAAAAALRSGKAAAVVCTHLPVAVQLARLVAQIGPVPLSDLWPPGRPLDPRDRDRFAQARRRLAAAHLRLASAICGLAEDAPSAIRRVGWGTAPELLVIDAIEEDLCYVAGRAEEYRRLVQLLVAGCRSAGASLVLCSRLPWHLDGEATSDLLHDIADVVVLVSESAGDEDGPLRLTKNRWGPPCALTDVIEQFHFARFAATIGHDNEL